MTVLSHVDIPGFTDALFVHDQLVFVLHAAGGFGGEAHLLVYDASDPTSPILLSDTTVGPGPVADMHGIYYSNGILYLGTEYDGGGVFIYDVADPTAPALLSQFVIGQGAHTLRYVRDRLYVMSDGFGDVDVRILDVSDPQNPAEIGAIDLLGFCHDLSIMENVGYASAWSEGLALLDLTASPSVAVTGGYRDPGGVTTRNTHSAWPSADRRTVFTCHETQDAGLRAWDVTQDPPQLLATYNLGPGTIVHDVMVVGDHAYVTYYGDGVRVVDVSDPAAPVEVGSLATGGSCGGGFCGPLAQWVEDGLVYVLDANNGLWVLSFDLPHDARITLYAVKSGGGADVALSWNHTGESQYTVRRHLAKETVAGARLTDVDAELRHRDAGVVPDGNLYYYKINGPWK
jgi:hypothetical protein